jgi:hypothetical protein
MKKITSHRLYNIWNGIKVRCYNKNRKDYYRYGGRGIVMCDKWKNNPESFIKWALNNGYRDDLQIDRIDNDGPYSPKNCRFVTHVENMRNSTTTKLNEILVAEIRGQYKTKRFIQKDLAKMYGVNQACISKIILHTTWKNL